MKKVNLLVFSSCLMLFISLGFSSCNEEEVTLKTVKTSTTISTDDWDDNPSEPTDGGCAAAAASHATNDLTLLSSIYGLRTFFKNSNTGLGAEIIRVYYSQTNNITKIMVSNPNLTSNAYNLLKNAEPFIIDFVNNKNELIVSQSIISQIETFLYNVTALSNATNLPNNEIISLLNKIKLQETVGLSTQNAWLKLVANYNL